MIPEAKRARLIARSGSSRSAEACLVEKIYEAGVFPTKGRGRAELISLFGTRAAQQSPLYGLTGRLALL